MAANAPRRARITFDLDPWVDDVLVSMSNARHWSKSELLRRVLTQFVTVFGPKQELIEEVQKDLNVSNWGEVDE